ncbi:MAG: TonB-dependent receptor plug domain-containing protein, partial [Dysgonomonas mossii]|nr:TonB-dependent receptor plug domain-containing protein [Dysgonomonas mossii]
LVVTNNNLENKKGTISILPSTKKSEKSNNLPDQLLILIDGKESSKKDMDSLDPNNIESVEVLKNKDAASAYGNKNVIKITLKK